MFVLFFCFYSEPTVMNYENLAEKPMTVVSPLLAILCVVIGFLGLLLVVGFITDNPRQCYGSLYYYIVTLAVRFIHSLLIFFLESLFRSIRPGLLSVTVKFLACWALAIRVDTTFVFRQRFEHPEHTAPCYPHGVSIIGTSCSRSCWTCTHVSEFMILAFCIIYNYAAIDWQMVFSQAAYLVWLLAYVIIHRISSFLLQWRIICVYIYINIYI